MNPINPSLIIEAAAKAAADPARVAAEKIVRIFGGMGNMHVNDILPDIREALAAKDAEINRLRVEISELRESRDLWADRALDQQCKLAEAILIGIERAML